MAAVRDRWTPIAKDVSTLRVPTNLCGCDYGVEALAALQQLKKGR